MKDQQVSVVLVSGGSSGIGAATARLLAESGITVYAGSRRGTVEKPAPRIIPIRLDVNDEASLKSAVEQIVAEQGHLDAVVCNAGNGIFGPIEGATDEEARFQFETCLFGSLKTIQACLPVFRRQNFGRIVTITSVMAILQLPFQGFYSAAKAALLSVSESLQMELKGTGIECCSVLPGDVATGFTAAAQDPGSPYRGRMDRNLKKIEKDEIGGMQPEVIGKAVCKQLKKKHMAVRVIPRIDYGAVGFLVRILPERAKLWLLDLLYS